MNKSNIFICLYYWATGNVEVTLKDLKIGNMENIIYYMLMSQNYGKDF